MAHTWIMEVTGAEARQTRAVLAASILAATIGDSNRHAPDHEVIQKLAVRAWEIADVAFKCGGYVAIGDMSVPGPGLFSQLGERAGLVSVVPDDDPDFRLSSAH